MKHGDKNAKTAKAVSQASGKKGGGKDAVETTKSGKTGQAAGKAEAGKETRKASDASKKQQAGAKESSPAKAGAKTAGKEAVVARSIPKGDPRARIVVNEDGFTNATVGNAFKRAIKKYPNAFRRLTD